MTTQTETRQSRMKESINVTLKRKDFDDEAIDTKETKRHLTNPPYRSRINSDQDLWKTISVLRQDCRTSGIIPKLEPNLKNEDTQYAYLCSDSTDYISTGIMDLGWGCGYRNCQMLMSFLEKEKQDGDYLLKQVIDISSIQLLLEKAWQEAGFDPLGAKQLKNHVFKTRKWIGTTEVYTLLAYLGIRSTIIDFHQPGPQKLHKDMFDWIQSYFTSNITTKKGKKVYTTHRPPLYLQHQGHSRTVVGIEILKSGKRNLIIFDPGRRMLRSFTKKRINYNEDTESSNEEEEEPEQEEDEEEDEEIDIMNDHKPSLSQRFFSKLTKSNNNNASSPYYPHRVDDKTIAKHRQYQILVLGQVVYQQGEMHWDENKGYLVSEEEREAMKNVTSLAIM
ncbi:hypothetical protein G6F57_004178 [Rhizopus arrhizus]|nr:hypothetical protein G6F23_000947 [Rhizopus arrhizus]KAG0765242.1 hypothetical protein G6F24_004585 [Rhizopus arrhizus]KAG0813765.1 hypothetical protein G6F20_005317 [Rhizopus arrhizus]KAG0834210.1 hypothetical protein G6F19_005316 [Rhizopus arrhizus]KAG0836078.1 hypothetical protein G6F18_005504 [Rhizopus arrhizus]